MLILEKEMFSISPSARTLSFGKDFDCGQGSALSAKIFCLGEDVCSEQGF